MSDIIETYLGDFEIIHHFTIMHKGWEMDNDGWIVKDHSGKLRFLTTSHGRHYFSDLGEIEHIISQAQEAIDGAIKAKAFISA